MLKGDVSVYEEYRIGPGPPGPAGPAGAPGYFALFIALALGRLHVCVCARVLSFPRTSRGCVRRIHAPERIPHTGYAQAPAGRGLPPTAGHYLPHLFRGPWEKIALEKSH